MSQSVKVIVLRTAGTNCNEETAFAFSRSGAEVEQVHVNALVSGVKKLSDFHILALPGGFSYGDDIASGRILANELRLKLGEDIKNFIRDGKLIIGICNGFQILVKAGILPGLGWQMGQEATLFYNDSAKFEARWVHLKIEGRSVWTKGMTGNIYLPVAHGEGKFIPRDTKVLEALSANDQVVFRYCTPDASKPSYPDNPNGSVEDIAGICDPTGRVLGLMPHPERHFLFEQHPFWTRLKHPSVIPAKAGIQNQTLGDGAKIFENGVNYVKENLFCHSRESGNP
ncbi:MAG: phosphoribosylformylglycinamidine synthase I [Candidatus Omnitrophica bacterium]|nr:phosphoribosylformylglycinamidine synthase I [Candidatus Omnitrophota bacterium]